jgi:putative Mg2+ transporter-C (MgtC) family protein
MLHDLDSYIVLRLLLAALLGGLVGLERELRHKPAGLRTNMLICFGSALFTIISYQMAGEVGGDHTRIAAQIIPGIGFIGAGVVIRERGAVMGITSAATIFVIASVGMAVGAGMIATSIFATLILLVALIFLGIAEERIGIHPRLVTFRIASADSTSILARAHQIVEDAEIQARRWHSHKTDTGDVVEFDAEITYKQERALLEKFQALNAHCDVRPIRP